jgi:hypothetical protein
MSVYESCEPAVIEVTSARTYYGDIYHGNGWLCIAGKDTGTAKWIGHPSNENVPVFQKRAPQFFGFCLSHEPIGPVAVNSVPNICQLNQPHVAVRILILGLDPIPINENAGLTGKIGDGCPSPSFREFILAKRTHAARASLSSSSNLGKCSPKS